MTAGAEEFRLALFDAGLLVPGAAPGVYHRSFDFEEVVRGIESYVSAAGRDAERRQLFCAPLLDQTALAKSGYVTSFPNLIGVLTSFTRPEKDLPELIHRVESGGDWPEMMSPNGLALGGAACHHIYPTLAGAEVPDEGLLYEVQAVCHRHEPSDDPARMQSFSMREFVYVGSEEGALAHRDLWLLRGAALLQELGLAVETVPANDPFFGRAGKLMGASQREKEAKFELVAEITSSNPGAISSGNFHGDHFGEEFHISLRTGVTAHSSCFGFGLERITLALFRRHGFDTASWPADVRRSLNLDTH
jgi:seryl-tRNA synthetase